MSADERKEAKPRRKPKATPAEPGVERSGPARKSAGSTPAAKKAPRKRPPAAAASVAAARPVDEPAVASTAAAQHPPIARAEPASATAERPDAIAPAAKPPADRGSDAAATAAGPSVDRPPASAASDAGTALPSRRQAPPARHPAPADSQPPAAAADGARSRSANDREAPPAVADAPAASDDDRMSVSDRPLLLRTRLDVRWGDMDAFNHVNNSTFLTYLEEARLRWLQALPGPWLDDNTAPLLAAASVNYRRPIEWPARLAIELYADRVGNSSLTIGHRVLDARDPDVVYSDGHTVMVWIDRRNGKGSRLPAAVRQACVIGVKRDRGNG